MQGSVGSAMDRGVLVQHRVTGFSEQWVIIEGKVPESVWHSEGLDFFRALLKHWIASTGRDAVACRDLAIRVRRDRPSVGFSPDITLIEPAPPDAGNLSSLRLWEPGHAAPALAVEIVSPGHPYKDYTEIPDQCAAIGIQELVVFDPKRVGPKSLGGPPLLSIWRRTQAGTFTRVASGDGPFESEVLGAWLVVTDDGLRLRIASDPAGEELWLTAEEAARLAAEAACRAAATERRAADAERGSKDTEEREKDAERAEKERALARVAELEAELRRVKRGAS